MKWLEENVLYWFLIKSQITTRILFEVQSLQMTLQFNMFMYFNLLKYEYLESNVITIEISILMCYKLFFLCA